METQHGSPNTGCRVSPGGLYANFAGKEELFLAVIREEQARHLNIFQSLLKEEPSGKRRLKKFRDAIADLMTDHDWISCFGLNSRWELVEASVSGKALLKCIGSSFTTVVGFSGTSCDLLKSLRD